MGERRHLAPVLLTFASLLTACGGTVDGADRDELGGQVIVFAAASLADAFEAVAAAFTDEHPGVEVVFNLAGSQTLASQINEGAPADVFASANATQMAVVGDAGGLAEDAEVFTTNLLEIAVEAGNPLDIQGLADLARSDVILVLPAEEVPAGQYAREALDAAAVDVSPASLEQDVRAALAKVELGEADASVVYLSDIVAAGERVRGVPIPAHQNVPAAYPIAVLAEAPNPPAARAFVSFVLTTEGQAILSEYGFTAP